MKSRAGRRFWQLYHELPARIREAVDKQFALWQKNPHHRSLRFKRIRDNLWSARVTDDFRNLSTCDGELERGHGVCNEAKLARHAKRLESEHERLAKDKAELPMLARAFQRLTVRSVNVIRWLRVQFFTRLHHEPELAALRQLYATL